MNTIWHKKETLPTISLSPEGRVLKIFLKSSDLDLYEGYRALYHEVFLALWTPGSSRFFQSSKKFRKQKLLMIILIPMFENVHFVIKKYILLYFSENIFLFTIWPLVGTFQIKFLTPRNNCKNFKLTVKNCKRTKICKQIVKNSKQTSKYRRFANVSRIEARLEYKRGQFSEKINRSTTRIEARF